ncbi:MAG: hypothetical protein OCD00_02880 [Colwellia sp.]
MNFITKTIAAFFISITLTACVTLKEVQQSTDLLNTEQHLNQVLTSKGKNLKSELAIIAVHAVTQADELVKKEKYKSFAISYYRIAATAYWQAKETSSVNDLFKVANSGQKACGSLEEKAPDRDCLFLYLVLPFASMEEISKNHDFDFLNQGEQYGVGSDWSLLQSKLNAAQQSLQNMNMIVGKVIDIGHTRKNLISGHNTLKQYYCENAKEAKTHLNSLGNTLLLHTQQFLKNPKEVKLHLSSNKVASLRISKSLANYCQGI